MLRKPILFQHVFNHAHYTARNGVGHLAVNLFAHAVSQIIGNALIGFFAAAEQSAEQAVYYAWFFGFFGLLGSSGFFGFSGFRCLRGLFGSGGVLCAQLLQGLVGGMVVDHIFVGWIQGIALETAVALRFG